MNQRTDIFEKAPIPRAVATLAIPTMITTLIMVVYNLADTFFIGQTGDPVQVAAVSTAFPIFTLFTAMGSMFGIGGNSSISRSLGAGRNERVKHISAFCVYSAIGTAIVMAIIILTFMPTVLNIIGASEANYEYAKSYLTYIALGSPFIITAQTSANLLRGEGAATASMVGNMTGTITNIILDPVFILVFGWGVSGAAIATVLGNVLACIYYLIYFLRPGTILSINIKNYSVHDRIAVDVLSIGLPSSLNQLLMSFATIIMNNTIIQYGDIPLAAMNVAMRTNSIIVMTQMGLCMGVQPLIGYNYGAGNKKRLIGVYRFTAICTFTLGTILTIIMVFARQAVVGAFIDDPEVISYGIQMVVALQTSGPFIGFMLLSTNCLQGMGKATSSLLLTLCRQVIVYIPAIFILNHFFGLNGLMWAQPAADYFAIILGVTVCLLTIRRMKPSGKYAEVQPTN